MSSPAPPLDLSKVLAGRRLVVLGGTGFLGKVWWSFLLSRYPEVGRLYLVMRPKGWRSANERFWEEIANSQALSALREQFGSRFEEFLREKISVVEGDVVKPLCGLDSDVRAELRGTVDIVVNAAGVVDFDPPLDEALEVNAFGVQNLVGLARDLGNVPLLHTSTCYVAGDRTGHIEESDPREHPFPRADSLERAHWDPDREIAECLDVIEQARHRASDAFRQSRFLDEAKRRLAQRGEPARGDPLKNEVSRCRRQFIEARLAEMGMERANFWGFPNTYTYTKAIGEQIAAASGLPYCIVRPAIIESTLRYPFPGWNEGINTSAPLIYILRQGGLQIPGAENILDVIPCDLVSGGMTLALAELLEGRAARVYHLGSSDSNPCTTKRFFELSGLYKRRYYQKTGKGGPFLSFLQAHYEGALLSSEQFRKYGPLSIAKGARAVSDWLDRAAVGPAAPLLNPAAKLVGDFASQQRQVGKILSVFVPFSAEYDYVFRCDHVRSAYARLSEQDKQRIGWTPENIDWRHWFLDVHIPALEKWVFPKIEERVNRPRKPPQRHETLPALLDEMAERYDLAIALQRTQKDGLSWLSFRDWRERAGACAVRLRELGVRPGERVLLAGKNHPAWPVAFFGIVWSGATAVPVEAGIEPDTAENLLRASGARVVVLDRPARERLCVKLNGPTIFLDLLEVCEPGPTMDSRVESSEDIAALIYTSGTTGVPKGVMLSHANLTSLVAALVPLFPLGKEDRILSVLPLHHTFELTCGMLLPLSRGSRIVYLDELKASELESALKSGRITGLIGVPALWEMLERSIHARVAERGKLAAHLFEFAVELNRTLGKKLGVDAGRLLFGPVHEALGGHLRFLVSGGAALNPRTHELFAGLGLHLSQGYGLTEAAPVLTVAAGGPRAKSEQVGKPIPGVELRIESPNRDGVGEVVARGPNVMVGYSNQEVGGQARDSEGWLHTGDLGRIDRQGHLVIVGRSKDTIVTSNGENVYPEDVEARLGRLQYISELAVVGLADTRSGERVACAAVAEENPDLTRSERHALARRSLETAISKLPTHMQPVVTVILDAPLPRTQTRKVKRAEVRKLVEHVGVTAKDQPLPAGEALGATELVRSAAAAVCRRDPGELHSGLSLRGDLAFDSLMLLEFLVAVEARAGANLDAERFAQAQTLADVEDLVRDSKVGRRLVQSSTIEKDADRSLMLPPILREAAMRWLGQAQMSFYDHVLSTKVTGRAFIPHNRHAIVAANHASHLDMGLVKYALGAYGQGLVSLAAQDYFFEGKRWRKAYFENLTNLVPLPRNGSLRQALRQVGELLEKGKTVLIFPEGTRTVDGDIHEFKPAIGHLALHQGVDVLPVWLGGTFQALPKGATVLRQRNVDARIGPPLEVSHLKRLTYGMLPTEASRTVAQLVRRAVLALSRGELLDIKQLTPNDLEPTENAPSLEPVFRELANRFVAGCVEQPVSYYFSLGTKERWSVRITPDSCEVAPGKAVNPADCVLKTSPAMFTRIVREAYTPSPAEFVSGTVKSNNIALLLTFQRAFQLQG